MEFQSCYLDETQNSSKELDFQIQFQYAVWVGEQRHLYGFSYIILKVLVDVNMSRKHIPS